MLFFSLVVGEPSTRYVAGLQSGSKKKIPFFYDKASFTSRNSFRKFPLLSSLHRATDGALVGALIAVAITSTIALHSQSLWSASFSKLEITRDLTQRLLESTASLENYLLKTSSLPDYMEPTEAKDLIYLKSPEKISTKADKGFKGKELWKRLVSYPINYGY